MLASLLYSRDTLSISASTTVLSISTTRFLRVSLTSTNSVFIKGYRQKGSGPVPQVHGMSQKNDCLEYHTPSRHIADRDGVQARARVPEVALERRGAKECERWESNPHSLSATAS